MKRFKLLVLSFTAIITLTVKASSGEGISAPVVLHSICGLYNIVFYRALDNILEKRLLVCPTHATHGLDVRVCADGSKSTIVEFSLSRPDLLDIRNFSIRMKSDPGSTQPGKYGVFESKPVGSKGYSWTYTHPAYLFQPNTSGNYRDEQIEIMYSGSVLRTLKVRFMTPPVVMVHGLWGSPSTFDALESQLKSNYLSRDDVNIRDLLVNRVDYSIEEKASRGFSFNAPYVKSKINETLFWLALYGVSCGKVDIVAHSMGGLVTRQCMVDFGYAPYMRKLITANSPHSGSQAANYLLGNFKGALQAGVLINARMGSVNAGAVHDLQVGISNNGVGYLRKNSSLALQKVPSHAIHTDRIMNFDFDFRPHDEIRTLLNADEITLMNVIGLSRFSAAQNLAVAAAGGATILIKYYLSSVVPAFQAAAFNGDSHDIIVPTQSQKGGLQGGSVSYINNQKHMGSVSNTIITDAILNLLAENPGNTSLFATGFDPPILSFNLTEKFSPDKPSGNDSLIISQPLAGSSANPGDTIDIIVVATSGINSTMMLAGNDDIGYNHQHTFGDSIHFKFLLPMHCPVGIWIHVTGQDSMGFLYQDSVWVNVNYSLVIDSISVQPNSMILSPCGSTTYAVTGHYQDSLRVNLTGHDSLSINILDTTIAILTSDKRIHGLSQGVTQVLFVYSGDTLRIPLTVHPDIAILKGDSVYCSGGQGVEFWVENPLPHMTYTLLKDDQPITQPLQPVQFTLSFGTHSDPGTYSLLTYDSLSGCSSKYSSSINLRIAQTDIPNLGNDTVLLAGDTIVLNAACNGCRYLWSDASEDSILFVDSTGLYWVEVFNSEGCTEIDTIFVQQVSMGGMLTGSVVYGDSNAIPFPGVTLLLNGQGGIKYEVITSNNGSFGYSAPIDGPYNISLKLPSSWGGVDTADIYRIMRHFVDIEPLQGLPLRAADVNSSNMPNAIDALLVARRINSLSDTFPSGDWIIDTTAFSILPGQPRHIALHVLWSGDVNASYKDYILWSCGDSLVDHRDNQKYGTVTIGSQCWMSNNLNIGHMIIGTINQANNSAIEKYCYNNDTNNCNIYGGLYQWDEMMSYAATPGIRGICPFGWHVPTDMEWCSLMTNLDDSVNCNTYGLIGLNAGGKMKSTGFDYWNSPNTGATNSSGFSALGAGHRTENGNFGELGNAISFWSSTESSSTHGIRRTLIYYDSYVEVQDTLKSLGFSVRCIKDTLPICTPKPDQANAGPDQLNITGSSTTLQANQPNNGSGVWSVISGTGGAFGDINNPHSVFQGVPGNTYTLSWTISTFCGFSSDTLLLSFSNIQSFVLGEGTLVNTSTGWPTSYGQYYTGQKAQYLILASELQAMGAAAGDITALAFHVVTPTPPTASGSAADGSNLKNYTIKISATSVNSLSAFASGLTQVYITNTYTTTSGWNSHPLDTVFHWDGNSNLLVETCFENYTTGSNYSSNAIVYHSNTSFNSFVQRYSDSGGVCTSNVITGSPFTKRPNILLTIVTSSGSK